MTKTALRREIAAAVAALSPDYCRRADEAICRHIRQSELYRRADVIFCYVGTAREIHTLPLIEAALADGKVVAVPLCTGRGIMEARAICSVEELVPGAYGIPEPAPHCPVVPPQALSLALIPCCTGNDRGRRLGYGGGFYDRYLPGTCCPRVLLCRGALVREDIPAEVHDLPMDWLVTEDGLVACRP